jgi:tRNA U34 5-methylaminomethyl-2-thiouridine-forming methyltransferase MnmC
MQFVITQDGSPTIYDPNFGEHHHILQGAYTEASQKFALIAKRWLCRNNFVLPNSKIRLLDLPFGLGYNLIASLDVLLKAPIGVGCIECTAIEFDQKVLEAIATCPFDEVLKKQFEVLLPLSKGVRQIRDPSFGLDLLLGDLRVELPLLAKYKKLYDLIFYDSFSPRSAPELWSTEKVLQYFYDLLDDNGLLVTYSASNKVRRGLLGLGFYVAPSDSVGRKMPGTVAAKNPELLKVFGDFTEATLLKISKTKSY